jgi:hypothetical protein
MPRSWLYSMNNKGQTSLKSGRSIISDAALIFACAICAYLIANLVDLVRPDTLIHGRDFRSTAWLAAALIALVGFWRSFKRRNSAMQMCYSLVLVEAMVVGLILFFSGNYVIDTFFLDWFMGINLFLAIPWLIGIGIGKSMSRD